MDMGWLLPTFHKNYWIGLNATTPASRDPAGMVAGVLTTSSPGHFAWLDQSAGAPGQGAYTHWGRAGGLPEPNNLRGSENCGLANASQTYGAAWGWSDSNCRISAPFICKSLREPCATIWPLHLHACLLPATQGSMPWPPDSLRCWRLALHNGAPSPSAACLITCHRNR